ncbi:capsule biosynthesis phosphatase [Rhexocercosporidium sp. MPI-PUGE-AT-0058]|nr:capsule biosynthesis phosphatase [Rhexocercosporidium sp. MPI-PUGE-AT-0058]
MPGLTTNDVKVDTANAPSKNHALNVIIPIGGIGSRFSKVGYRYPKPLINIIGRPMILRIIDNLSLSPEDTLWMAVNAEIDDEFRIGQLVMKTFPKLDFRLLRLKHQTKGASETLYMTTQSMGAEYMGRRTVSLDCDTLYWADILQHVRDMPIQYGAVFYFPDDGFNPIYSYIKTEDGSVPLIIDIREKKAISNKANTGAYVFATASLLHIWAAKNIDSNAQRPKGTEIGEYYTSQMIGTMIHDARLPFLGLPLSKKDFSCVGTPEQLEDLLMQMKDGQRPNQVKKRRFCFDLDMTLVGVPAVAGDYSTCPPIWKNIRLVQQLHKAGHHIIIQTARRMRTHQGNVGAILKDVGPVTFEQLERYEIPYHDIHFGKPWADVYVDDLAVNANLDTMKEIGWLLDEVDPSSLLEPAGTVARTTTPRPNQTTKAMIAARDFNTIQIVGDKVIKSSKSDAILGELFFYAHMPTNLLPVFPTGFAVDFLPETGNYTLEMEYRQGLTFSHLLVGRSITEGRLLTFLTALHSIHTTTSTLTSRLPISAALADKFTHHSIERSGGVNIYANYGVKLRSRYYNNSTLYSSLGPTAAECFSRLNEFLDTYEAEDRGVHVPIIHGDPVFSNAILSQDDKSVSFIDVRCQLENTLTMEGDIHYDLAKVLQSLVGYDHILFMDIAALPSSSSTSNISLSSSSSPSPGSAEPLLDEADERILLRLQDVFWRFLEEKYAVTIHKKTLLRITASLLFSLIPLHKRELGPVFLRMCRGTLEMARGMPYKRAVVAGGSGGAASVAKEEGLVCGEGKEIEILVEGGGSVS